jgi:hypothetical protein
VVVALLSKALCSRVVLHACHFAAIILCLAFAFYLISLFTNVGIQLNYMYFEIFLDVYFCLDIFSGFMSVICLLFSFLFFFITRKPSRFCVNENGYYPSYIKI